LKLEDIIFAAKGYKDTFQITQKE